MSALKIDDILEFLFDQKPAPCSERFKLVNVNVMGIKKQLFATAQLEAIANEDISGAQIYLFDSGADLETSRFCGGVLGTPMGGDETKFKLPLTLSTALFPFEIKEAMKIQVIVAISTRGQGNCYLTQEVSVTPRR
jgi:hypothetical protein